MIDVIVDAVSWVAFAVGGFFLIIGAFGMIRLNDFWARLHAVSIIDSAGITLILFGLIIQEGFTLITIKLILIIIFVLITAPTASHAMANAAFVSGLRPDTTETTKTKNKTNKTAKKTKKSETSKKSEGGAE